MWLGDERAPSRTSCHWSLISALRSCHSSVSSEIPADNRTPERTNRTNQPDLRSFNITLLFLMVTSRGLRWGLGQTHINPHYVALSSWNSKFWMSICGQFSETRHGQAWFIHCCTLAFTISLEKTCACDECSVITAKFFKQRQTMKICLNTFWAQL